jgi:hypothetical protein
VRPRGAARSALDACGCDRYRRWRLTTPGTPHTLRGHMQTMTRSAQRRSRGAGRVSVLPVEALLGLLLFILVIL